MHRWYATAAAILAMFGNFCVWYHDEKRQQGTQRHRSHPGALLLREPARLIVRCCQSRLSPHQSLTNKILKQQSVLTKSSALIHNYPCNSYYSFYHPLALIPIIPSRTVSTLLSLGISHTTRIWQTSLSAKQDHYLLNPLIWSTE